MTDEPRHPIDVLNDAADLDLTRLVVAGYDRYGEWQVLTTEHPLHAEAISKRAYVSFQAAVDTTEPLVLHS